MMQPRRPKSIDTVISYLLVTVLLHNTVFCTTTAQPHVKCLQPFVPENGHVIFNEAGPYSAGTVAKYSCALGFERLGVEERVCRRDGTWSGSAPYCAIDVALNKPTEQSSSASTTPNVQECFMTNDEGQSWREYELLGSYSIVGVTVLLGKQSTEIIALEVYGKTGQPKQCNVAHRKNADNSSIFIACHADHVAKVRIVAARRLHMCKFKVHATNAVSSWQCAQGAMDVLGVFDGTCYAASNDEQNDWLGAQRKCLDRGASLPLRIGKPAQRGIKSSLSASSKQKGFYWIGATSSTAGWRWADGEFVEGGDWPTATEPTPDTSEAVLLARALEWKWLPSQQTAWNAFLCQSKPKFCTSPGVGEASKVTFSSHSYAVGTQCFYTCDDGYELDGESQRECEETGRWSGSIPACRRRSCGELDDWAEGTIRYLQNSTLLDNEAQYECMIGTVLMGHGRRRCTIDGSWSGEEPHCEEIDCGRTPQMANGFVNTSTTTFGSKAIFTCKENYRLIGQDSVHCSAQGTWEPAVPVCYDLATIRAMKGESAAASENNILLALLAIVLVGLLVIAVFKFTRTTEVQSNLSDRYGSGANVIYATPSIVASSAAARPDSVVYYAPFAPIAQLEVPPHMLQLQQLPNGNIHVTLPISAARPLVRPTIPVFEKSPTPSQLLYSFDHEPIYDIPPELPPHDYRGNPSTSSSDDKEDNIYEKLTDASG